MLHSAEQVMKVLGEYLGPLVENSGVPFQREFLVVFTVGTLCLRCVLE